MVAPAPPNATSPGVVLRLGLAMVWALILGASVLLGERATSMGAFDDAVAAGRVHTVRLVGELAAGASGVTLVELHWRDRLIARVSQVRQVSSDVRAADVSKGTDRVVVGDLAGRLSVAHPGLQVISRPGENLATGLSGSVLGWRVPGWIAVANLVAWLTTLAVVIGGPEPWRATRWAWFWIIAHPLGPISAPVFLLLSGPTPLLRAPKPGARRLHGGWAFLLAVVTAGVGRA